MTLLGRVRRFFVKWLARQSQYPREFEQMNYRCRKGLVHAPKVTFYRPSPFSHGGDFFARDHWTFETQCRLDERRDKLKYTEDPLTCLICMAAVR